MDTYIESATVHKRTEGKRSRRKGKEYIKKGEYNNEDSKKRQRKRTFLVSAFCSKQLVNHHP